MISVHSVKELFKVTHLLRYQDIKKTIQMSWLKKIVQGKMLQSDPALKISSKHIEEDSSKMGIQKPLSGTFHNEIARLLLLYSGLIVRQYIFPMKMIYKLNTCNMEPRDQVGHSLGLTYYWTSSSNKTISRELLETLVESQRKLLFETICLHSRILLTEKMINIWSG